MPRTTMYQGGKPTQVFHKFRKMQTVCLKYAPYGGQKDYFSRTVLHVTRGKTTNGGEADPIYVFIGGDSMSIKLADRIMKPQRITTTGRLSDHNPSEQTIPRGEPMNKQPRPRVYCEDCDEFDCDCVAEADGRSEMKMGEEPLPTGPESPEEGFKYTADQAAGALAQASSYYTWASGLKQNREEQLRQATENFVKAEEVEAAAHLNILAWMNVTKKSLR